MKKSDGIDCGLLEEVQNRAIFSKYGGCKSTHRSTDICRYPSIISAYSSRYRYEGYLICGFGYLYLIDKLKNYQYLQIQGYLISVAEPYLSLQSVYLPGVAEALH